MDDLLYPPRKDGKCRLCRADIMRRNYENNKEKIAIRTKAWRDNNPEKVLEYRENQYKKDKLIRDRLGRSDYTRMVLSKRLERIILRITDIEREYEKLIRNASSRR